MSPNGQDWKTALSIETNGGVETGPIRSGRLQIETDTIKKLKPSIDHGILICTTKWGLYPKVESTAMLAFDIGGSPQLVTLALGPKARNVDTASLTGTNGPSGMLSIGVAGGEIIIENRVGPNAQISYLIIG